MVATRYTPELQFESCRLAGTISAGTDFGVLHLRFSVGVRTIEGIVSTGDTYLDMSRFELNWPF